MKQIKQISDIPTLALPHDVEIALTAHLLAGFESELEANAFWLEYGTHLTLIEPSDTDIDIDDENEADGYWIDFIANNPEYVLLLGTAEPYLLALAIVDTSGAGAYGLLPVTHPSRHTTTFRNYLNNPINNQQIGA